MGLFMRPRGPLLRMAADAKAAGIPWQTGKRNIQWDARNKVIRVPVAVPVDTAAEVERLARLHRSGVLNDAEFAAAKSQVLGT